MTTVYEVTDLVVDLYTERAAVRPVDGVSYSIDAGESVAIVGESGSGKTVMSFAPLGLMPPGVETDLSGRVMLDGKNIVGMADTELGKMRGKVVSTIFQDPMTALNPARRLGRQISEVCELHLNLSRQQADTRALDLMKLVGISDPEIRMKQYPHELSGGLCQRVMIAIAIATEPKILIADEPTTALDVTVQAQILELLKDLRKRLNMAMILITHDIGVVAGSADRVLVMYAGRLAEQGAVEDVLIRPQHPYTKALIAAIPRIEDPVGAHFRGLEGMPPVLAGPVRGCAFAPRCDVPIANCTQLRPSMQRINDGSAIAACHLLSGTGGAL